MRKCLRVLVAAVLCMALFVAGCSTPAQGFEESASAESTPNSDFSGNATATPVPQEPTPSPKPTLPPLPKSAEIVDSMRQVDILEYVPEHPYPEEEGKRWYEPVIENESITLALPEQYLKWLEAAVESLDIEGATIQSELEAPSWPMLAAIITNYNGDTDGMREALFEAGGIEAKVEENEARDGYNVRITAHPADPKALFYALPESEVTNAFSLFLSYAYLATVFDETLHGREGIGEPELEPLLFPMSNPENYYFIDCWGDPRDGGLRRHTGTDINAPEGTDLLAAVDGVILDKGTNRGAGNYIVLEGGDGTQYHYYHMVTPSDVPVGTPVATGDVIGHVGDTGNSTANHLHFTIVTADGHYVNPYHYLLNAQEQGISD